MTRVIHFGTTNTFSGAENVVCQIISVFKRNPNFHMIFCVLDGPIKLNLEERNIPYFTLKRISLTEMRRAIKEYKPDIIHAHDIRASVFATLVAGKIPIVTHVHANFINMNKWSLKAYLFRICSRRISHIFWVSESALKDYRYSRFIRAKSYVLRNVMDTDLLKQKMAEDSNSYNYDVIYLGRITYQKNPERLIEVLNKVVTTLPGVKIAIIGEGDLRKIAEKLVAEYNLHNNIDFLGFQDNPLKILHDGKVMVMVSRFEGTPMCALEAMILGVPIVSTPTDGLLDLVDDGITGYLSDDDSLIAEKIVQIVKDKELQKRLSNNVQKKAESLMDLEQYYSSLLSTYENL